MVGNDTGAFEVPPQQRAQRPVHARTTSNLGLFEKLQAAVERKLAEPVLTN